MIELLIIAGTVGIVAYMINAAQSGGTGSSDLLPSTQFSYPSLLDIFSSTPKQTQPIVYTDENGTQYVYDDNSPQSDNGGVSTQPVNTLPDIQNVNGGVDYQIPMLPSVPVPEYTPITVYDYADMQNFTDYDVLKAAAALLKTFEGFSPIRYQDPPGSGKYSIGYGHQIKSGESFTTITEAQGYTMLVQDVLQYWSCVKSQVTNALTLNQAVALTSLCYNIGCTAFTDSTLLKYLNTGNYAAAADEFAKWNRSSGTILQALVIRRQEEQNLFESA